MRVFLWIIVFLGGMLAVVREYIEKGTFEGALEIQRQLLADYREDLRANKNLGVYKGALYEKKGI